MVLVWSRHCRATSECNTLWFQMRIADTEQHQCRTTFGVQAALPPSSAYPFKGLACMTQMLGSMLGCRSSLSTNMSVLWLDIKMV